MNTVAIYNINMAKYRLIVKKGNKELLGAINTVLQKLKDEQNKLEWKY